MFGKYFATEETVNAFALFQVRHIRECCLLFLECPLTERKGGFALCNRCPSIAIACEVGFLDALNSGRMQLWADDWQHIPLPIRLKSTLTTLDLRHFVWNIAERLGSKKDYTGEVRAIFIKRMFPDVMRDIELDSIRNFKFQPDTGNIVIDEPDKGDYHFHFE